MEYYQIILYAVFGLLPSLAWLFYYLAKDMHPEPKKMILKVFIWGGVITIPTLIVQISLARLLPRLPAIPFFMHYPIFIDILKWFVVIALTEELAKYLVVRMNMFGSWALDEPLDIMLYMVVGALGFSAVENMLYLFSPIGSSSFNAVVQAAIFISFMRFIGATFLHTLCSGLVGYFLAESLIRKRWHKLMAAAGIGIATLLHGLYNFSIITLSAPFNFLIPLLVIFGLMLFMFYDFNEIKKVKSICKL